MTRGAILALGLLVGLPSATLADTLIMEGVEQASVDNRPVRGMSMESVQARYGAPLSKRPAVGDPPITRWEYQDFVVYFEYRFVIHAVKKR